MIGIKNILKLISLVLLILLSLKSEALVRVEPSSLIEGQAVQLVYSGCEPPFSHIDSNEFFYITTNDKKIQFVGFYTLALPTCPIMYERTYRLGLFSEGEYEVEVYLFPANFPLPIDLSNFPPNQVLSFGVSSPVSVPVFSSYGIITIIFLFLLYTFKQGKASK